MFSIFKTLFRTVVITGVVGGVVAGGTYLIAGSDRTEALMHQMHNGLIQHIDQNVDDPVVLRSQLAKLEREYPERITQVRGDLAELNEQIRQIGRDQAIAMRVVELTEGDLAALDEKLAAAATRVPEGNVRLASLSFENRILDYDRAMARRNQIQGTRNANASRAQDAEHDLAYLNKQARRLEELLVRLETEHASFQGQIWQLSRQVDAIARNERLIEMMDARNQTIEECSRYQVVSLDQLTDRLAEYRSRQEAELDLLTSEQQRLDYEDMARVQVEGEMLNVETEINRADGQLRQVPGPSTAIGSR